MDIAGYQIIKELGRGGMATVYLAEQESFERQVALKVMSSALVTDPSFRERFIREAKIVAKISHPNIVAVYDVGESNGNYYIAMEYHNGGDLKDKVRRGLTPVEAINVIKDIARALDFAHSHGFVHRDIKPDNVLFRHDGTAVLTDFGIAKASDSNTQLTQLGTVAGTPKYMSPEQARGQPLDGDSDLYSLGVVFFEMLAGDVPFKASDAIALGIMHLRDPVPPLPTEVKHFQKCVEKMMSKSPAQRYQRGEELIHVLNEIEREYYPEGDESSATVFRSAAGSAPSKGRGKLYAGLGTLLLAASAGGGFYLWSNQSIAPAGEAVTTVSSDELQMSLQNSEAVSSVQGVAEPLVNIPALYAEAELALVQNRLTSPAGNNALEKFQTILAVEPKHQPALEGVQRIADRYLALVDSSLNKADKAAAQGYLDKATDVMPSYALLAKAQQKINNYQAPVAITQAAPVPAPQENRANDLRTKLRIGGLLRAANTAIEDGRLVEPVGDNAQEHYQTVLSLDSGNADAKAGLKKINSLLNN